MSKTNIIEFVTSLQDGGAETLVKDYALLMDKERFDVTVVVVHDMEASANLTRLREGGIRIIALSSQDDLLKRIWRRIFWRKEQTVIASEDVKEKPVLPGCTYEKPGFLRRCRNNVRNFYFGLGFLKVLRRTGATVVHGHLDVLRCLQMVSPFLKGIRLIHTCHALPELIYEGEEGLAAEYLIRHNGLQLVALHPDMAKQMDAMFPGQKTAVIRNGINMNLFREPGVTREAKRQALGIPADAFVVGHVGRFTPEKNHTFLVDVFAQIAQRKAGAYLLMVGVEDHTFVEEKLRDLGLQDRYQILTHRSDVNELLCTMDVFVFPSIYEGLGIALIEAQAAGIRCIASDRCPEEVFRTETCIPMPLEMPQRWAEAALDPAWKRDTVRDLDQYDMNREIRRLEGLYLGQLNDTID